MPANIGYFAVVNTTRSEGDTALLTYIRGGHSGAIRRGLQGGPAPLQIYHTHHSETRLHYPQRQKFVSGDITDFRFRYDAAEVPQTIQGRANSQVVPCTIETLIGGQRQVHNTHFVKITNIGALTTLNPASFGVPAGPGPIYGTLRSISGRARQLAMTCNSQAQEMLVGVLII
jgi:hypothetical protein